MLYETSNRNGHGLFCWMRAETYVRPCCHFHFPTFTLASLLSLGTALVGYININSVGRRVTSWGECPDQRLHMTLRLCNHLRMLTHNKKTPDTTRQIPFFVDQSCPQHSQDRLDTCTFTTQACTSTYTNESMKCPKSSRRSI